MIAVPWLIPALVSNFWVSVVAEILIWSLFAASVNLLFGYVGLLSFGQALYFGFGMYGVAIGIQELGLSFWPAFALGIIASMAMALVDGHLRGPTDLALLRDHHRGVLADLLFPRAHQQMADRRRRRHQFHAAADLQYWWLQWSFADPTFQYLFILASVAFCFWLMHRLIASPLGKAFVAIRDNDVRASLIGLNVYHVAADRVCSRGLSGGRRGCAVRVLRPLRLGELHVLPRVRRSRGVGHRRRRRHSARSGGRERRSSSSSARWFRPIGSIMHSSSARSRSWW